MFFDWNQLSEEAQIALSRAALHHAVVVIAEQAEVLAHELECGGLADRGGADALRLFAAMVRVNDADDMAPAGHA